MKRLVLIVILFLCAKGLWATHILASDIYWSPVGKDSFLVTIDLYRDCNGINFGNHTFSITCDATNSLLKTYTVSNPQPIDITPVCKQACTRCQNSSCAFAYGIELYRVQTIIDLSQYTSSCCDIRISYSMCCRGSLSNMVNDNFYTEAVFDACLGLPSPIPNSNPISLLCVGHDASLDLSVNYNLNPSIQTDSIIYELSNPLRAHNTNIPYTGNYSAKKPIYYLGFPTDTIALPKGIYFDSIRGYLMFRPMKTESVMFGVKIKIYRNGNLISTMRREFYITTLLCNSNSAPALNGKDSVFICNKDTLKLDFTTDDVDLQDTVLLSWDESLPGANWITQNDKLKHSTAVLTWVPDTNFAQKTFYIRIDAMDNACPVSGRTSKLVKIITGKNIAGASPSIKQTACRYFHFETNPYSSTSYFEWSGSFKSTQDTFSKTLTPGIYPYELKIIDTSACGIDTAIIKDTLIVDPPMKVELPRDTTICYGSNLFISPGIKYTTGNIVYHWSNGDSNAYTSIKKIKKDTFIKVIVQDEIGCLDSAESTVLKSSDFYFIPPDTVCFSDTVDLSLYSQPSGGTWSGTGITNEYFYPQTASSGKHKLIFNYIDTVNNCNLSSAAYIRVLKPTTVSLTLDQIDDPHCTGDKINLSATPTGGVWSSTSGKIIQNKMLDATQIADSFVTCKLTYTFIDAFGCPSSRSTQINLIHTPVVEINAVDTLHCYPGDYTSIISYTKFAESIFWDKVKNNAFGQFKGTQTNEKIVYTPSQTDIFLGQFSLYARVQNSYSTCKSYDTILVKTAPFPEADFELKYLSEYAPVPCKFTDLSSIESGNIVSYFWDFGNGDSSHQKSPTINYDTGTYHVTHIVYSDLNCIDTVIKTHTVVVKPPVNFIIEEKNEHFKIYPNPGKDYVDISSSNQEIYSIRLLNINGSEILRSHKIQNKHYRLNIKEQKKGTYILHIILKSGEEHMIPILIQ